MADRADVKSIAVSERAGDAAVWAGRIFVELAGFAAMGFVASRADMNMSPFGVAAAAALPGKYSYCAALGALLGYVISPGFAGNVKYIGALMLVAAIKWIIEGRFEKPCTPLIGVFITLGAMAAAVGAWVFGTAYNLYEILIGAGEMLAGAGAAYFFARTFDLTQSGQGDEAAGFSLSGVMDAGRMGLSCSALTGCVLLMGLSGFSIGPVSIGRVLAVLLILISARYWGEAAGAVAGIAAGAAIGLSGGDFSYIMPVYAIGGLAAGMLGHAGRVAGAGAFIAVSVLSALLSRGVNLYGVIAEVFAASAVFMVIPASWAGKLRFGSMDDDHTTGALLREKLAAVSTALRDVSATTRKVSEKLEKLENGGLGGTRDKAAAKVCRRCGNRTSCWQFNREETSAALDAAVKRLQKDGGISRENAPKYLTRSCCKLDAMLTELNGALREHMSKEGTARKVSKVRSVMNDQFDGMAQMLDMVSGDLSTIRNIESGKLAKVTKYLERENFKCLRPMGYTDSTGRLRLSFYIPAYQLARVNKAKMSLELSDALETELGLPQIDAREKEAAVYFAEKAVFTTELGAYQIPNERYKLCGDAYSFIQDFGGQAHMIISDGMGSGGSAAVDSTMAANLLTQLLSAGVGHGPALKFVNSALLVKSGDESLATVDLCSIDLFTGRAVFHKAGAAPSFIIRRGRCALVDSASLPAGILHGVSFEKSSAALQKGDTVVMVSDGVIATGMDWVRSELEHLQNAGDVQGLCEKLAMTAKLRRQDGHSDDITVIAAVVG